MEIINLIRNQALNDLTEADIDCSGCEANCCKMHWLIELTSDEAKYLEHDVGFGRFYIKNDINTDYHCIYLTNDNKCSIHDIRPKVCRSFDCRNHPIKIPNCKYKQNA